jgi:hypothetical protein
MDQSLQALEATRVAAFVRESLWAFPAIETLHIIGLALLLGSIGVLDLRLLGFSRQLRVTALARHCLPPARAGFALAGVTGLLMFAAQASAMAANGPFRIKMLLIALAGINVACFHRGVYRRVAEWDEAAPPPFLARLAGALSLALWTLIITCGRLIAFL